MSSSSNMMTLVSPLSSSSDSSGTSIVAFRSSSCSSIGEVAPKSSELSRSRASNIGAVESRSSTVLPRPFRFLLLPPFSFGLLRALRNFMPLSSARVMALSPWSSVRPLSPSKRIPLSAGA